MSARTIAASAVALALWCAPEPARGADPDERMPGHAASLRGNASLRVTAKPAARSSFALPSAANDPTVVGGSLAIFDTAGADALRFALPVQAAPRGWRGLGKPPGARGYRYRGDGTPSDPCRIDLRPGLLRVACDGPAVSLMPPLAGDLGVILTLGSAGKRYCVGFGGETTRNALGRLERRRAPAGAACPSPFPDSDGDGVADSSDRCPSGDDRVDEDGDGAPDACQDLAVRTAIDDFEGYDSDAALSEVWSAWPGGADVVLSRAVGAGEDGTTGMEIRPIAPDPVTGNTWASVSRGVAPPAPGAHDGLVLRIDHAGTLPLGLGLTLTESGGEPWAPAGVAAQLRADGQAWQPSAVADANGVIALPAGFRGFLRLRLTDLSVPAWYGGAGDRALDQSMLATVSIGFDVAGRSGEHLRVDSLAWWYGIDPAIAGRIARRTWPSILQAWNGIDDEPAADPRDLVARHDLLLKDAFGLGLIWSASALWETCSPDPGGSCLGLSVAFTPASITASAATVADLRARNPNLLVISEIRYRDAWSTYLPANHRFWQHDAQGSRIPGWAEGSFYLLDWHDAELRALVATQAAAAVAAGADGVFLDWWDDADDDRIDLVQRVRAAIGNRLLWINSNDRLSPRSAPWVNGAYMEGYRSATAADWQQLGDALAWNEAAFRQPRVNGLETWFANGRVDLDRMRATTTLALVRSDGWAMFGDPNDLPTPDHLHSWYDFWNQPLGVPLLPGALAADGSWRREFGGGTAVYNPMGNAPIDVSFAGPRRSAATGLVADRHTVPAGDGDLFLP